MPTGRVVEVNAQRGMVIIQIADGEYAVFELLDGIDIEVGDSVRGDLGALGGEQLVHLESAQAFEAYGQSGPSSLSACRALL